MKVRESIYVHVFKTIVKLERTFYILAYELVHISDTDVLGSRVSRQQSKIYEICVHKCNKMLLVKIFSYNVCIKITGPTKIRDLRHYMFAKNY